MSEKLYDIFISYSSKDAKVINALTHYLEERCLRCFVAYRDVPYGEDWAPHILKAVKDAKVLVYVHSENSNDSKETTRELNLAFKYQCTVIPFRIDKIDYIAAKEYRLINVNWLDAFENNPEEYFEDLYHRLEMHFPERTEEDKLRIRQELVLRERKRIKEDKENPNQKRENRDRDQEESKLKKVFGISLSVITYFMYLFLIVGITFKLNHWPGGTLMLLVAIILMFILVNVHSFKSKLKSFFTITTAIVIIILGCLLVVNKDDDYNNFVKNLNEIIKQKPVLFVDLFLSCST